MVVKLDDKRLQESHILLHPIRFRLVEMLTQKPMFINELSKAIGEERRLVSYHLRTLEDYGFVSSRYEISEEKKSKGKALRRYWVTDKVEQVKRMIKESL